MDPAPPRAAHRPLANLPTGLGAHGHGVPTDTGCPRTRGAHGQGRGAAVAAPSFSSGAGGGWGEVDQRCLKHTARSFQFG